MPIILRLDRVMADRKVSLNELAARVGIANVNQNRQGKRHPLLHAGGHLRGAGLPARRYSGIQKGLTKRPTDCGWAFSVLLRLFGNVQCSQQEGNADGNRINIAEHHTGAKQRSQV